jgi:hypothetical protein
MNDTEQLVARATLAADYQNLTKLFARVQLGRIAPALSLWQWLLIKRWRRAVLVGVRSAGGTRWIGPPSARLEFRGGRIQFR